jgi:hypothetical protein
VFSHSSFNISDITLRSSTQFELIFLYRVRHGCLISVFYMWIYSFPSTICWRCCFFSNVYFGHLCQRSDGCNCVGLFLHLLLHCSTHLILGQCYTVFVTMAL